MASPAQIEANRRNAQKSHGPITLAGKEASRANVVIKHGLSGKGIVLADEQSEVVNARAALWAEKLGAVSDEDRDLARQIALEQFRIAQCQHLESDLSHEQARRAVHGWDKQEFRAAVELAKGLKRQPESVSLELEETTHGCALKVKRWERFLAFLKKGQPWDKTRCDVALDLLGVIPELRDPEVNEFGETVEDQSAFARDEIARLKRERAAWLDDLSARRQASAAAGYAFPEHKIWLIRRYEAGCTRRLNKHFAKLVGRTIAATTPTPAPAAKPSPTPLKPRPTAVAPPPPDRPRDRALDLMDDEKASLQDVLDELGARPTMTLAEALAYLNGPVVAVNPKADPEGYEASMLREMMAYAVVQKFDPSRMAPEGPQPPA